MLKIWFMYDNHGFARVEPRDKLGLIRRAKELFAEDGCGSLFVRDEHDAELRSLTVNGHRLGNGQYGVTVDEIVQWADDVVAEEAFRHRMNA